MWTPDGTRLAFTSTESGSWDLHWKPADGSGEEQLLLTRVHNQFAHSWSPDGALAFFEVNPETARDIWILPPEGEPEPLLQGDHPSLRWATPAGVGNSRHPGCKPAVRGVPVAPSNEAGVR